MVAKIEDNAHTEVYAALGKYVASFSRLMYSIQAATMYGIPTHNFQLIQAAFGDRSASQICDAFFSVVYIVWRERSDDDNKIIKAYRTELTNLYEKRNRLLHDLLQLMGATADARGALQRQRLKTKDGHLQWELENIDHDDLERTNELIERLEKVIWIMYGVCRDSNPKLSTALKIVGKEVHPVEDATDVADKNKSETHSS